MTESMLSDSDLTTQRWPGAMTLLMNWMPSLALIASAPDSTRHGRRRFGRRFWHPCFPATSRHGASLAAAIVAAVFLAGCTTPVPDPTPVSKAPAAWQGTLPSQPHGGDVTASVDWWRRVGDPVLTELIAAAQADNPGLAITFARIEQSRAAARVAGAALMPKLNGTTNAARSKSPMPPTPVVMSMATGTLDAAWELDLFGAVRHSRSASVSRAEAARLQWHDARISLAAEVAQAYVDLRSCEAQLRIHRENLASLQRTEQLTTKKVDAGFGAPADFELATASAADGAGRVLTQEAQCRQDRLTLAWLTGLPSAEIAQRLASGTAQLPQPAVVGVSAVPADVLAQRPDLAALQKEIEATSYEVGAARAERYPKLRLTGAIGYSRAEAFGMAFKGPQWSIGPGLVAPLFDGGRSAALVAQADARFVEALATWQQRARLAVREVESALIRIDSAEARIGDADRALAAYQRYLRAAESRYETGVGSLFEQEDARRSALLAGATAVQLRAERFAGWLSLYKAVGGDWREVSPDDLAVDRVVDPVVDSVVDRAGDPAVDPAVDSRPVTAASAVARTASP